MPKSIIDITRLSEILTENFHMLDPQFVSLLPTQDKHCAIFIRKMSTCSWTLRFTLVVSNLCNVYQQNSSWFKSLELRNLSEVVGKNRGRWWYWPLGCLLVSMINIILSMKLHNLIRLYNLVWHKNMNYNLASAAGFVILIFCQKHWKINAMLVKSRIAAFIFHEYFIKTEKYSSIIVTQ